MEEGEEISNARVDELLRFLPVFEGPGELAVAEWHGGKPDGDAVTLPYPFYSRVVLEFFELAAQPWWSDYGYDPVAAGKMVDCDACIAAASLAQIRTMLTYCVRGERFCDGHWEALIRTGRISAILRRLRVLQGM